MRIKAIAFTLTLLMLLTTLISCTTGDGNNDVTTASSGDQQTGSGEPVTTEAGPGLEAVDYGGKEFVVLNLGMVSTNYPYMEINAEAILGEVINDAVYERNDVLNSKYNINIVSNMAGDRDAVSKAVEIDVSSGDSNYHLIMQTPSHSVNLAARGQLYDYSELPNVNLDAEWWFRDTVEQLSISNMVYYAPCYANICFLSSTGLVYFNKELIKNFALQSPYELVGSGDWTLEKFIELSRNVTSENNKSLDDTVGFRMHPGSWGFIFMGLGGTLITKDADDLPVMSIDEQDLTRLQTTIDLSTDSSLGYYGEYQDVVKASFVNGKTLFMVQPAYDLEYFRQMADFGILPMPKYDAAQTAYINTVHQDWGSFMMVESTHSGDDLDMIGRVLEDLAYESYRIIKPAYYDIMLQGRFAKDEESAAMLDIIYEHVTIDLSLLFKKYGIGIDTAMRKAIQSGSTSIASTIQSQKRLNENLIKSVISDFEKRKG